MDQLLSEIKNCNVCAHALPLGPNPVVSAHPQARIMIVGQAPGVKVHQTGIPWNDASGGQLRKWLGVGEDVFYDPTKIALVPMGFCYPGKGNSGDLPPRKECAPLWHERLIDHMEHINLILLVGQYAQRYYLGNWTKNNLTETVRSYRDYLPTYMPLPHPSPRNGYWTRKNTWFETEVLPALQHQVNEMLNDPFGSIDK